MKTRSNKLAAANTARYFDAMLAISNIHFTGVAQATELALKAARETVGECLSATRL